MSSVAQNTTVAPAPWARPTISVTESGAERRVGVEIEFANLDAAAATDVVTGLFGGRATPRGPHRVSIADTALGDFTVELDFSFAHGEDDAPGLLRRWIGDIGAEIMPMEVVCPPVVLSRAHELEALRVALHEAGAVGTRDHPLYALGAQLNPEVPSLQPAAILNVLRAFLLLRDWLRDEIDIDWSRRLTLFADPLDRAWGLRILDPDYAPDAATLIDDYLDANPTRNRELDMLPLFAFMDEPRVRAVLPDEKIKARPTFHYRLPNALVDDTGWTLGAEWNRWCAVEQLAARPDLLADWGARWRRDHAHWPAPDWTEPSRAVRAAL